MNFLNEIVKQVGGEYTSLASNIKENETFVDTGSYIFNALVSGSIYGGVSGNKITAIAGETSTGKCARGSEKITIYCDEQTKIKIENKLNTQ